MSERKSINGTILGFLALWALVGGLAGPSAVAAGGDPHEFEDVGCDFCHLGEPGDSPLREGMDTLCAECHAACRDGRKHVGELAASSAMEVALPLGDEGVMGCTTCHDPHGLAAGNERLLRIKYTGRSLCLNCHRVGGERGAGVP